MQSPSLKFLTKKPVSSTTCDWLFDLRYQGLLFKNFFCHRLSFTNPHGEMDFYESITSLIVLWGKWEWVSEVRESIGSTMSQERDRWQSNISGKAAQSDPAVFSQFLSYSVKIPLLTSLVFSVSGTTDTFTYNAFQLSAIWSVHSTAGFIRKG